MTVDTHVLDVSNYDASTFDASALYAAGIRRIIVGTQDENACRTEVQRALAAGLDVIALYVFVYFGTSGGTVDEVARSIALCRELGVSRLWIDCELDGPHDVQPSQRNAELVLCVSRVRDAGLTPGIYTYRSWWVNQHANTTQFSDLPLWYANYGANDGTMPPIHDLGALAFGGWTKAAIHQYWSIDNLAGRNRDVSYLFEEDDLDQAATQALIDTALSQLKPQADRLNDVLVKRFKLINLATDPDATKVDAACAKLFGG